MLNSLATSVKNQTSDRYNAALNNFFGSDVKIGEKDVFEILSKIENFESETEQGYTEQKAIGRKPTPVAQGEVLKKFSLNIKLHASFCNPDEIISKLEEKVKLREQFSYYQQERYIGEFVVNKVRSNLLDQINGKTIYAEITVDLLEVFDDADEEFQPQEKTTPKLENIQEVQETTYKSPVDFVKKQGSNIFAKLTDKVVDKAMRTAEGYINSSIGGLY